MKRIMRIIPTASANIIGETVRALRQRLGITQEKFATMIGVSFSTVNRWENGRSKPSPLALEKLNFFITDINKHKGRR